MRMRLLLIGVAAFAATAMLIWLRPHPGASPDRSLVGSPSTSSRAAAPLAPSARASVALEPSADGPAPRTILDGQIELVVKSERGPIAGSRVALYLRGPRDPNTGVVKWQSLGSSVTGRDGKAKFAAGPGRYLASARADGFATGRREIARLQGEQITVAEIELEKGLSLSGRTVARRGKGPVPLVEIILTQQVGRGGWCRWPDAPEEEEIYALSNASGRFRFEGLARSNYCVRARAPGFARWAPYHVAFPFPDELVLELTPASVIEGFVVGSDGKAAAGATVQLVGDLNTTAVETGDGGGFSAEVAEGIYRVQAQRGLEAGVAPKPVSVAAGSTVSGVIVSLGAGASIAGTIVSDVEGTPIAGAAIAVSPHQHNGDSGRGVSDARGQYLVQGLAPGRYDVATEAIGYAQNLRRGITVAAGQRFSMDLRLLQKGVVEGRVADSAGQAIPSAVVSVDSWEAEPAQQVICSNDGRYRLTDLPPGKAFLRARRNASSPGVTQAVNVSQAAVAQLDFILVDTGVLTGKVSRAGGRPPAETVWIITHETERFVGYPQRVEADASGNYRLELSPGDYWVNASVRSSIGARVTIDARVRIEAGKTVTQDFSLPETKPAFSGVVLEPGGTPASGAQIMVSFGQQGRFQSQSFLGADEDGRFEVSAPSGGEDISYTVTASKGGRVGQLSSIVTGSSDVTIQLSPAASVEGRVVTESSLWRGGFMLQMGRSSMRDTTFWESTLEFAGDTFFVDEIRSGPIRLQVRTGDRQSGTADVSTAPGEKVYVEIRVSPSASIAGRLIEAETGKPVSDARLFTEGSLPGMVAEVNADGSFRIGDLAAGSYTLRAFAPGRAPFQRTVTVGAGENVELGNLELQAGARPPREER